jgi:uncharacterized protein (DUF885 family)
MAAIDRRELLLWGSAAAAEVLAPAARAQPADRSAALNGLFDVFMQENLREDPTEATSLGLDVGPLAGLRARLPDSSAAGIARTKQLRRSQLQRLTALGSQGLAARDAINYEAVRFTLQTGADADAAFDLGVAGASRPYVITQIAGAYYSIPDFLDTRHPVRTAEDAEAYIARLQAFQVMVDAETDALKRDAGRGMVPPDFILDTTLKSLRALAAPAPAQSGLVTSLARRSREAKLSGDYGPKAEAIYANAVRPALERQIAAAQDLRARASHAAGIGARPNGEAFYALALKSYTTSSMSPAEVHRLGLDQTRAYQSQIDVILKAQGFTRGSVGERLAALSTDARYLWANTDAAKAQAVVELNGYVQKVTPRLGRMFHNPPTVPLEIRRVPPTIEAGAPLGYYFAATLDGSRPAIYYINLSDTANWPKWTVASVTFHEGVPGHHLQISTAQHLQGQPLLRRVGGNSGYAEGWGLYAEQLADELGMYEDDPLGRIGYLKSVLWRACRMVLDTGIHTMGWSREQSIRWKMDNDGSTESATVNEVERYCAMPGQAPSYELGHIVIDRTREQARARQGAKFDIRDFHDAMLGSGAVPLDLLPKLVPA